MKPLGFLLIYMAVWFWGSYFRNKRFGPSCFVNVKKDLIKMPKDKRISRIKWLAGTSIDSYLAYAF